MTDLRKAVEQVVESLDDGYIIKPGMSDHKALRAALAAIDDEIEQHPESVIPADEAQLDRIAKMLGEKP